MLLPFASLAQTTEPNVKKFYGEASVGAASNGAEYSFGLRAVLKNAWTTSLHYYSVEKNPKNLPADYQQGYALVFLDPFPAVTVNLVALTAGKLLPLSKKVWLMADAGLTYVNGETMTFTPQPVQSSVISKSSNYRTSTEKTSGMGGILQADLTWAPFSFMGFGLGGFAAFNSIESPVGFQLKLIVGMMDNRRK